MVPVITREPIAAIGNYWKQVYVPSETEVQPLQTLADSASRAIENIQLYNQPEERVRNTHRAIAGLQQGVGNLHLFGFARPESPLRGIDGYGKLLLDEYGNSLNEEALLFVKTIRKATMQMSQLIDDLLCYSRLERSRLKREQIDFKPFIESIVESYRSELLKNGAWITVNVPSIRIIAEAA